MNKLFHTILTIILTGIISISCQKNDVSEPNTLSDNDDDIIVSPGKTVEETMAKMFFHSLFQEEGGVSTRSADLIENITMDSICYNNQAVLHVGNLQNEAGYVIISADKTEFPIISFADQGNSPSNRCICKNSRLL